MICMRAWSAAVWLTATLGFAVPEANAFLSASSAPHSETTTGRAAQDESMLHNDAGGRLFEQGNLEGAAREFREAIRLSPRNPTPHNNLGMVLHVQGQPADALEEFQEAVTLNPSYAPAWSNLGFAFYELDQLTPAMMAWRIAVDINQQMAGAWAGLALGQFAGGQVNPAIESYRQAIHLDPRYADLTYLQRVRHWSARALDHADTILSVIAGRQQASLPGALI
jgi:protein O-GlcNAc transferase